RDLRHTVAQNAGFENFRDYMFESMGRFDYTPQDCFRFHEAIANVLVPLLEKQAAERRKALDLDELRPWDMDADPSGKKALKPFSSADEIIDKTAACFGQLDPYIGERITIMKKEKLFDL